jgi:hypothetical protein
MAVTQALARRLPTGKPTTSQSSHVREYPSGSSPPRGRGSSHGLSRRRSAHCTTSPAVLTMSRPTNTELRSDGTGEPKAADRDRGWLRPLHGNLGGVRTTRSPLACVARMSAALFSSTGCGPVCGRHAGAEARASDAAGADQRSGGIGGRRTTPVACVRYPSPAQASRCCVCHRPRRSGCMPRSRCRQRRVTRPHSEDTPFARTVPA